MLKVFAGVTRCHHRLQRDTFSQKWLLSGTMSQWTGRIRVETTFTILHILFACRRVAVPAEYFGIWSVRYQAHLLQKCRWGEDCRFAHSRLACSRRYLEPLMTTWINPNQPESSTFCYLCTPLIYWTCTGLHSCFLNWTHRGDEQLRDWKRRRWQAHHGIMNQWGRRSKTHCNVFCIVCIVVSWCIVVLWSHCHACCNDAVSVQLLVCIWSAVLS